MPWFQYRMQIIWVCCDVVSALSPQERWHRDRVDNPVCHRAAHTKQEKIPGLYCIYCFSVRAQLTSMLCVSSTARAEEWCWGEECQNAFFPSPGGVLCVTNTLPVVPFPGAGTIVPVHITAKRGRKGLKSLGAVYLLLTECRSWAGMELQTKPDVKGMESIESVHSYRASME